MDKHITDGVTTIVLDVGGVLFLDAIHRKIRDLAARYDLNEWEVQQIRWELRASVDLGERSEAEFWTTVLAQCGVTAKPEDLSLAEYVVEVPGAHEALRLLADRFRLAILSNDSEELSKMRRSRIEAPIEVAVISAEVGTMKPEHSIYRILFERLSAEADECLFIDDRAENVEAAREMGMRALHFTTWEEALSELGVP
jgi:putative hydrolase of the HAD superfamily